MDAYKPATLVSLGCQVGDSAAEGGVGWAVRGAAGAEKQKQ